MVPKENVAIDSSKSWDLNQLTAPTISQSASDLHGVTEEQSPPEKNELKSKTTMSLSTIDVEGNHANNNELNKSNNGSQRCQCWTKYTDKIREGVSLAVVSISVHAARHPYFYIAGIVIISLTLAIAGAMTNISIDVDPDVMFTPRNTIATQHDLFIRDLRDELEAELEAAGGGRRRLNNNPHAELLMQEELDFMDDYDDLIMDHEIMMDKYSGFLGANYHHQHTPFYDSRRLQQKNKTRGTTLTLLIHSHGLNVATREGMSYLFKAYETIKSVTHVRSTVSALNLWDNNITLFEETALTDQDVRERISLARYPDGTPIDLRSIVGNAEVDSNGTVTYAASWIALVRIRVTRNNNIFARNSGTSNKADEEGDTIDSLVALKEEFAREFAHDDCGYTVEFFTTRAFEDELFRGIAADVPLLPVVIIIMAIFTCVAFFRPDRVRSRCLLGLGGVVTIVLSMMSGYGVMFCFGVPINPMTTMLPFVVLGIGLDDTFIISLAFDRTDEKLDPVERIRETMQEVGLSISITTMTTTFAFILGLISSVPSIYQLCWYAFATILIDFFYQITFFVALTVLDARRIQANRSDCCTCFRVSKSIVEEDEVVSPSAGGETGSPIDRLMGWYANKLLRPWSKVLVLFVFFGYLAACIFCTTLMEQEFRISDLTPNDSFIRTFFRSMQDYTTRTNAVWVYFRDLDQSNPEVRQLMRGYIDDLVATEAFGEPPAFCWIYDFDEYLESFPGYESMTFYQQLDMMMGIPEIEQVYGNQFYRDSQGTIKMSRCQLWYGNLDLYDVQNQMDTFNTERQLAAEFAHENACGVGPDEWPIFTFSSLYYLWEFYNIIVGELILTTLSAIFAVAVVTLFVVPHWTAIMYIIPTIMMLYIDLIGTLQFAGVRINAVSYIALVISIGLMVDFVLHMLIKYYESEHARREDKVRDALSTMGSSVLLGGLSTFVATIPMLFASSKLFNDIFDAFFAVVILSICHGLIFLPVVLSLIGPEDVSNNEEYVPFSGDKEETENNGTKQLVPVEEGELAHSRENGALPVAPFTEGMAAQFAPAALPAPTTSAVLPASAALAELPPSAPSATLPALPAPAVLPAPRAPAGQAALGLESEAAEALEATETSTATSATIPTLPVSSQAWTAQTGPETQQISKGQETQALTPASPEALAPPPTPFRTLSQEITP